MSEHQRRREESQRRYEAYLAEAEAKRRATPLIDRLRASGPFTAEDGHTSLAVGNYKDAHEAADEIERLRALLAAADEVVVEVQLSGRPFHEHPDPHALADCRMCRKVVRYRELKEGKG